MSIFKKIILTTITFFFSLGMASNSIADGHINWSEVEKKQKKKVRYIGLTGI